MLTCDNARELTHEECDSVRNVEKPLPGICQQHHIGRHGVLGFGFPQQIDAEDAKTYGDGKQLLNAEAFTQFYEYGNGGCESEELESVAGA